MLKQVCILHLVWNVSPFQIPSTSENSTTAFKNTWVHTDWTSGIAVHHKYTQKCYTLDVGEGRILGVCPEFTAKFPMNSFTGLQALKVDHRSDFKGHTRSSAMTK